MYADLCKFIPMQLVSEQFSVEQLLNSVTREDLRRLNLK